MSQATTTRAIVPMAWLTAVQLLALPACAVSAQKAPSDMREAASSSPDTRQSKAEPAASPRDTAEEARGRKIVSTAFVRIPPGGVLHITLQDGQALTLRDVVMNAKDYCGIRVDSPEPGKRYCGGYSNVLKAEALLGQPVS